MKYQVIKDDETWEVEASNIAEAMSLVLDQENIAIFRDGENVSDVETVKNEVLTINL